MRTNAAGLKYRSCTQHGAAMTAKAMAVRCTRNFIAAHHRQTVRRTGGCLVQKWYKPEKTCPGSCKDLKDGPQLALMHRLHGPGGALGAAVVS